VNGAWWCLGRPLVVVSHDKLNPENALERQKTSRQRKGLWLHAYSSGVARPYLNTQGTRKDLCNLCAKSEKLTGEWGIDMFLGVQTTLKWKT